MADSTKFPNPEIVRQKVRTGYAQIAKVSRKRTQRDHKGAEKNSIVTILTAAPVVCPSMFYETIF